MRGKPASKRKINPDLKYRSVVVSKLINQVMRRGKKSLAENIVYFAFDYIKQKTNRDPLEVFDQAMKNLAPYVEVKGRRIGGANYQVPEEVRGERRLTLALRWLIAAAKSKKSKSMKIKLAEEILAAAKKEGEAIKKKEEVQRMAEANRAFAHFA